MTDRETLVKIHDILFGTDAWKKDYEQYYTEVAMVMIGWAQTYFSKEVKS